VIGGEADAANSVSPASAASVLAVRDLHVRYKGVIAALNGIDIDVPRGKIVALLGPNGAGKSTTLKAISGLLKAEGGAVTKGDVLLDGASILGQKPSAIVRRGVAQSLEGRRVFTSLTVEENLQAGGYTRRGNDVRDGFDTAYSLFPRLEERRSQRAGLLSGGEQQMLAIARALMSKPRILLLDEPSLGLAPLLVKDIFSIVRSANERLGTSVLLIEQNARAALSLADHGYVIENGQVVLSGSGEELRSSDAVQQAYLGSHAS
jgi:branched-chain amino acid transport system ATP-binding protein